MRANIFIVHRNDGLLRAIARLLAGERYRVQSAESIAALRHDVVAAGRPALLLIDEDAAGPNWGEQLASIPADVPRLLLTWYPRASLPPGVTPLGKPFRARELLEVVAERVAASESPRPWSR